MYIKTWDNTRSRKRQRMIEIAWAGLKKISEGTKIQLGIFFKLILELKI